MEIINNIKSFIMKTEKYYFGSGFFETSVLGNSVGRYVLSLVLLILFFLILKIVKIFIINRLNDWSRKTQSKIDDVIVRFFENDIFPMLYYVAFYISLMQLNMSDILQKIVNALVVILIGIKITSFVYDVSEILIRKRWFKDENTTKTNGILTFLKIFLWALCCVFILDNLGFDISAIITGLGIGGVAIALASQNILNDLFNYFVIFFDKPFEVGDFVIVGDFPGIIKHIGIKTTRVTSLGGEEIVFSNSDLTGSRVKNYKRMQQRRVVFKVGVIYQTSSDKLKKIPGIIKDIIENIDGITFDRSHFKAFGDFSLDFETVYYVLSNDYAKYMDYQQEINMKIFKSFETENIEFAYPTQSIFLEKAEEQTELN